MTQAAGRVGDQARIEHDHHGCADCAHTASGPGISGSRNVLINNRLALRVGDSGVHAKCCGPQRWQAALGSSTVLMNERRAHRLGDATQHCGGPGRLVEGSPDVLIGDLGGPPPSQPRTVSFVLHYEDQTPMAHAHFVAHFKNTPIYGRTDREGRAKVVVPDHVPAKSFNLKILSFPERYTP